MVYQCVCALTHQWVKDYVQNPNNMAHAQIHLAVYQPLQMAMLVWPSPFRIIKKIHCVP